MQRLAPGLGYLPSSNTWAKRRETSDLVDVSDLINKLLKCLNHNSGVGKTVASLWNFLALTKSERSRLSSSLETFFLAIAHALVTTKHDRLDASRELGGHRAEFLGEVLELKCKVVLAPAQCFLHTRRRT